MTEPPAVAHPDAAVFSEFSELASDEQIAKAAAALERNGIRPLRAATGADARGNILIINKVMAANRVTAIIVKEHLGF